MGSLRAYVPRIGVDVCPVERITRAVERSGQRFLEKVFTPAELAYCGGRADRLAGRWAAKEAVLKCLDGTVARLARREIEVLPNPQGAPVVRLEGEGAPWQVEVTITHDGGLAIGSAIFAGPALPAFLPLPEAFSLPERPPDGHKGTFGLVTVVAGSYGFTGAAFLCSTAAARIGAGTVRLNVARTVYPILAVKCTEVMASPIDEVAPGVLGGEAATAQLTDLVRRARVALIGPGLGRDPRTQELVGRLVEAADHAAVIDADGLNALAADPARLRRLLPQHVLTPHPGEMGRLLGRPVSEVQADRVGTARRAARDWGCVVLLKGAGTVVAAPDGRISVDPHSVSALGTGGSGDVLGGIIAGLQSQGAEPFAAAVSGVYVHAAAGRRLAARQGTLLASDLLQEVAQVAHLLRQRAGQEPPWS
ncbi:MAG: NAD(P)H-hydrate dehydratase [Candidatus Dormibacteraceae bacterium]